MNDQPRNTFNRGPPMRPQHENERSNVNRNVNNINPNNNNNNNMRIKTEQPAPNDINYWTNYENHFPPSPPTQSSNMPNSSQRPQHPRSSLPPNMNANRGTNSPSNYMGPNNMNQRNSVPPNGPMMGNNIARNQPLPNGNHPGNVQRMGSPGIPGKGIEADRMGPPNNNSFDRSRPPLNSNQSNNHPSSAPHPSMAPQSMGGFGGNAASHMSQNGDLSTLEKERILRNQIRDLEDKSADLDNKNNILKKQYEQLNTECQEKLELALNEVRKATVVEKNLKAEKRQLETAIQKLNNGEPLSQIECTHDKTTVEERVEVIVKKEEYNTSEDLKEKYKEVFGKVSKLKAENSQLKMVNERISKENEKWSSQIKQGGVVKDKEQDKQDKARLEEALKSNIANKLHLQGMERKMKKLEDEKERLEKEKKILLIKCKEARDAAAKNSGSSKDSEEYRVMSKENSELKRSNERVKTANADLIAKSKKNLEVALNEVKKSNSAKKVREEEVERLKEELSSQKDNLKRLHNIAKDAQGKNSKMKKQYDELAKSKGNLKQINSAELSMLEDTVKQLASQLSNLRNSTGGAKNTPIVDDEPVTQRAEKRLRSEALVKKEIQSDREPSFDSGSTRSQGKRKNDSQKDGDNINIKREAKSPRLENGNTDNNNDAEGSESSEEQIATSLEESIEQLESMESMDMGEDSLKHGSRRSYSKVN